MKKFLLLIFLTSSLSSRAMDIGQGIYDITGPAAEVGMMGYGQLTEESSGIHMRLWSRAFVLEDSVDHRVAIVTVDLCFVSQGVKLEVVKRVQKRLGQNSFDESNILIQATHTHAGPGGFSFHTLYNLSSFGFSKANFEVIVQGITESIVRAYHNREKASVHFSRGEVLGAQVNRSPLPFQADAEAAKLAHNFNPEMSLLRFTSLDGRELGLLNWFAVHATSLTNKNKLISSDNKGLAAYELERLHGSSPLNDHPFVAAFANSEEGDVSPHTEGFSVPSDPLGFTNLDNSARLQKDRAQELWNSASESLTESVTRASIDWRHRFVDMNEVQLPDSQKLCKAAMGVSFAAGAEDGPGGWGIHEGVRVDDDWNHHLIFIFLKRLSFLFYGKIPILVNDPCQYPKPSLVATGQGFPHPWTPQILPLQIVRIGSLAIIAVPFELTTVSGLRLKEKVLTRLAPIGVNKVVIAGLANAYASYVTTPEEYEFQHYEGACTQFGPNTLSALLQEYDRLASDMVQGRRDNPGPQPEDLYSEQKSFRPGVIFDNKLLGEHFGSELKAPLKSYHRGESVTVQFRAGHPKNNLLTMKSYLEVQKQVSSDTFETVAYDWDPETFFHWIRDPALLCLGCSRAEITWSIPLNAAPGVYRILHRGSRKGILTHKIRDYEGYSSLFTIED